ncbi:TIGR02680 family protein [Pseudonocardia sp. H11422]|uniref:TIGR02680 family protein n=1 Tax=Pseudonocardia sp. H11422 TaxID=2835866 RepID=UPI001BDD8934|nr:TIGR02680 family protein [Pseudonocardia sp. H11422]
MTTRRFRLSRAGVLNVWQYDDQVFEFADGRLLLRGSNGAGKSKTLEMLLPFVLDGDKQRMTASARHHTSLLWLMLDGYSGQNRAGYLWVEFARRCDDGRQEVITCGVGIRASQSARAASAWYFTVPGRIGERLLLEDDAGPLARDRLRAALEPDGHFFDSPRAYKQHVGRLLFGLEPTQYDELLRLLYWLRQPQVGEDIEPARLAEQLVQALPQLDDDAVRAAGDTFDELAAFGEQLDRQRRSAGAVAAFADVYADYAREVLHERGTEVVGQHRERSRRVREVERCRAEVGALTEARTAAETEREGVVGERRELDARLAELRRDPALRNARELLSLQQLARERAAAARTAREVADKARARAQHAGERVRFDADSLRRDLAAYAADAHVLAADLGRAGARAALPVPPALHEPGPADAADAAPAAEAVSAHAAAARAARPALGELVAAVQVVEAARRDLDTAAAVRAQAERQAGDAEQRAEEERGHRADAQRDADRAESEYVVALDGWRVDPRSVQFDPPAELSASTVGMVAALARAAAVAPLDRLRDEEKAAGAARAGAEGALDSTRRRRAQVAAEHDPAPPEPAWGRDPRDDADGAPLWRLVDFADGLDAGAGAGLEAALGASGLLDAWVRVDGAVLDAERHDVVLPAGPSVPAGSCLADAMRPDPPAGSPVSADVVRGVLGRVALVWPGRDGSNDDGSGGAASGAVAAAGAVVGVDGAWRLGPLTGRAAKPAAQYIGATARSAERARRLAELDARIAELGAERDAAIVAEQAAREAREAVESWLADVPATDALLTAWTRLDERVRGTERADRRAAEAEEAAVRARAAEAARRQELVDLAAGHDLPTDADGLAARREQLRAVEGALTRHADAAAPLGARLHRWAEDAAAWSHDVTEAEEAAGEATDRQERAATAQAAADELEQAVGATIREIQDRIGAAERRVEVLARQARELDQRIEQLLTGIGAARQAAADAAERLTEQEPVLAAAVATLAAVAETPGLLASGVPAPPAFEGAPARPAPDGPETEGPETEGPETEGPETDDARTDGTGADGPRTDDAAFGLARGFTAGHPVPAAVLTLARRLAELPATKRPGTETAVYAAWQDAASGPAGDCEPRVAEIGGALAVIGRDEAGEHPIGELAVRLAAAVARDAELLTDRERRLFEEHILGDLGESLRARRQESLELVTEMNQLLRGVTTSQGIQVQLRWTLRDDVAADARRAVELLGRPTGALLPDERRDLRDALHRLIEASRAEAPEDSYSEHLARALDYRRWFAFRIRYTRPENAGTWHDLHRRSPLSQGEQKVVCYLPLFAAAAAHFSSLAGAAPYSPRFVLLDDAFPKIDVRTHPLLFGLLVQLDLDFVVTSERLWGDHATVPSLAIYEALRDPNERGIAQYRHLWDGQRLQAVGA